jgi:hypothetical protein
MKLRCSIWIIRKWCNMRVDPILRCLDNPEGLYNGYLPSWCGPRVRELANGLRLCTVVLSQDLSGAWATIRG